MNGMYDVILGRDVLRELDIVLDFHMEKNCWNHSVIDMKPPDCKHETSYFLNNTANIAEDTERM